MMHALPHATLERTPPERTPNVPLRALLLDTFQRDFPLSPRPFLAIGQLFDLSEDAVLTRYADLLAEGAISRIGAVFAPRRVGASTLAAVAVEADRLDSVAAQISRMPGVNHNYAREHQYNLWFVATAPDAAALNVLLQQIETDTGRPVLRLPLEKEYHIDLGFSLLHGHGGGSPNGSNADHGVSKKRRLLPPEARNCAVTDADRPLIAALQPGLPLVRQPYAALAERAGMHEHAVLERLRHWLDCGVIKRFGVVVRHHELGYTANAMLVHDVPDEAVDAIGEALADAPGITLCYRRPRVLPHWRYNLFCMIHGRDRHEVEAHIAHLRQTHCLRELPSATLFSTRRYKQQGACYA